MKMLRRWPRADLRVGDEDRQRVVDELQRHYVAGRLTTEELGERVSTALHARTFADLAALVDDLPVLDAQPVSDAEPGPSSAMMGPPLGLILLVVGVVLLLVTLISGPFLHFGGPMAFWPFFFIFFVFGWPRGGRRRHF